MFAFLGMAGFDPCANRPILSAWMDRVKKEMGPHYEEAHKVVRIVTSKFGGNSANAPRGNPDLITFGKAFDSEPEKSKL